jgi:hypothetical protein
VEELGLSVIRRGNDHSHRDQSKLERTGRDAVVDKERKLRADKEKCNS